MFLLADDDTAVRARAREWFDDRAFAPNADNRTALEAAAAHSDPKSRAFAVSNLHEAEVSQVDTALMLTAAFTDREPAVRVAAATEAAHYFGAGPDILAGLFALLTDSEGDVRGAPRGILWTRSKRLQTRAATSFSTR